MKIIDAKLKVDYPSLTPEIEVVMRVPLELSTMRQANDETYNDLGRALSNAYNEYIAKHNLHVNWKM